MRLAPDGTFNENFLIKGNNLIALHALKRRYRGKVKLIYIDPPYNTGNDSFNYNDRFNHSVWLTFMKNRLEVARELLRDDGSIFVQLDHNEVHYAKVLMDEIFGQENFRNDIIWCYQGAGQSDRQFKRKHDNILFYSKTENNYFNWKAVGELIGEKQRKKYTSQDEKGYFKSYKHKDGSVYKKYFDETEIMPRLDYWTDISTIQSINERLNFAGQKPEKLLQRIIESSTQENDIVLDFFAGSGTTCAVAHKMKRRFIGIEQMDYIQNITLERLKKVIDGEQGGISKAVGWLGGGSVIYAALMPLNALFKDKINHAQTIEELKNIVQAMQEKAFLAYYADKDKLNDMDALSLNEAKEALKLALDSNMDYVLYGDIDDAEYQIDNETKAFNQAFYGA